MNPTHQPATQPFDRLRELEAKATPGPWALGKGIYTVREESKPGWQGFVARTHIAGDPMNKQAEENAELIAESRNLLPALLDSHAALVAALKEAIHVADEVHDHGCACISALVPCDCYLSRMKAAIDAL